MAGGDSIRDRNKTSEVFDADTSFQTIDELFKAIEERQKKATDALNAGLQRVVEAQQRRMDRAVQEWTEKEAVLREAGITNLEAYQKKMLEDNAKKERELKLSIINEVLEKEAKESTATFKKQKKEQAIANKEMNLAMLQQYKKQEESGQKLTEEQQKDKENRLAELQLAKTAELEKTMKKVGEQISNAVNSGINTYVKYQTGVNARLQGYNLNASGLERARFGSSNAYGILQSRIENAVGVQPYVKTDTMLSNLSTLVHAGIASNVEQRAFLESIKENIAETFDIANSSLLRIVRLQQQDSSAARLGMEAYLTNFLNSMVSNTEYLSQTFDTVQEALVEASSQMSIKASTEFEYVVQKWLGALTGTGLSENTASSIAQAIGQLGSGNISALSSSSMQNLLVMAASRSGLNYSDLLTGGLTASSANQLMNALTGYMIELGSNTNNVVRNQLAQTFGLSISDLTAATQLSSSLGALNRNMLSYEGMYGSLSANMNAIPGRMSSAQMVQNVYDNLMFGLSSNIASNPALAALWQITDLVQSTTGGINIPAVFALGTGVDVNATVEQLMKLGLVGVSSLGMIGDLISGVSSTFDPASMLGRLGIGQGNTAIVRGTGLNSLSTGLGTSVSTFVGQSSGNAIYESTMQGASDAGKAELEAKQQEYGDIKDPVVEYLKEIEFKTTLAELNERLKDLRDKVVDGEVEVKNSILSSGSTLLF